MLIYGPILSRNFHSKHFGGLFLKRSTTGGFSVFSYKLTQYQGLLEFMRAKHRSKRSLLKMEEAILFHRVNNHFIEISIHININ